MHYLTESAQSLVEVETIISPRFSDIEVQRIIKLLKDTQLVSDVSLCILKYVWLQSLHPITMTVLEYVQEYIHWRTELPVFQNYLEDKKSR